MSQLARISLSSKHWLDSLNLRGEGGLGEETGAEALVKALAVCGLGVLGLLLVAGPGRAGESFMSSPQPPMRFVKFEVWGRVQGVFFRKFTASEAKRLGLGGWCRNTKDGTVQGELEGPADKVSAMKTWLEETGSPASRIDKAIFTGERTVDQPSFKSFDVRK